MIPFRDAIALLTGLAAVAPGTEDRIGTVQFGRDLTVIATGRDQAERIATAIPADMTLRDRVSVLQEGTPFAYRVRFFDWTGTWMGVPVLVTWNETLPGGGEPE